MQNRRSTAVDAAEVKAQQKEHQAALHAQIEEKKRLQVKRRDGLCLFVHVHLHVHVHV